MRYHIIGIAGAGMNAFANLLLDQGHQVSGSDPARHHLTEALARRGATIHQGHDASFVQHADAVLHTAAVTAEHLELQAARAAGIQVLTRHDLWREWSQQRQVIAVSGTHGKTTTTSMIALILTQAGWDPGFLLVVSRLILARMLDGGRQPRR